ncbi:MAG: ABC transporter ATP-binding protein [Lachnospiraceae bacterium]|nr:ABC transporter ATP-binding protein [Lachnospiraceae bacterium]
MNKRTDGQQYFDTPVALIRYFLKGSIGVFVLSMVFASAVSFLDMVLPRIISFTVDSVIADKAPDLPAFVVVRLEAAGGVELLRSRPVLIAAAVLAVALAGAIFRYLFRYFNEVAAERFVKKMRDSLYGKIQRLPYAWHGRNSTGDIIQRCTSDVETIKVFVSEQLTSLVRVIVLIALAVSFMAGINGTMTAAASLFIPIVIGYSLFFYAKIGNAFEKADTEEGRLSAIAQENLTGVRVVRAFGRESYERERFEKQNSYYTGFWIHLMRILSLNWVTGDVMTGLQYLLVNIMGAVFCVNGRITAGEFIAFVSYNSLLIWPVRSLGRVISEMSKAGISLDRLRYIMNAEEEKNPENALRPPMDRDIRFENVSFSYGDGSGEAVSDVSFEVPAGTTLGILGGTGSGKSTLMYLLERLYPLEEGQGRILIGDADIAQIDQEWLRAQIGMVLQEPYLFSRTIAENIAITSGSYKDKDIRRASKTADLLETVDHFPSGFETFVGERGVTLSGGQKQRTAIAQMLIRQCPIMIFDDSLSAVDAETDARIRAALRKDTGDATVILIAHRITTIMHADQILVMDKGRIRERGTHEELLALGGTYRKIYDLQMAGSEEYALQNAEEERGESDER